MDERMPVLEVCHNREAHKDTKTLYSCNDRLFFVISITIPIAKEKDNGVSFLNPCPALVNELVRHDQASSVMIRHSLCVKCRGEVNSDIDEITRITQADN